MKKLTHLDLFSGIGGASIAVDAVFGKNNVTHIFSDNEPFAQAILKKHWPQGKIYGDIRNVTYTTVANDWRYSRVEEVGQKSQSGNGTFPKPFILTGGFPCQPFSQAGRRKGTDDDRYLWPEMLRVIREFKPQWVIGENVAGLLTWDEGVVLEQVCLDLEGEGYEVQPFVIPAVAVNAPHRRDRVWIVAHYVENSVSERNGRGSDGLAKSKRERMEPKIQVARSGGDASDAEGAERAGRRSNSQDGRTGSDGGNRSWNENWYKVATELCTVDDGLPNGLARPRGWRNAALKGTGNAWVPQVAIEIMKGIKAIDKQRAVE